MQIDPYNIVETKTRINELIKLIEQDPYNEYYVKELKEILEIIGQDKKLFKKYEDIYDEASDALVFSSFYSGSCKYELFSKKIPPK